jgi:peptide/nickel transport system substrate-binding protein
MKSLARFVILGAAVALLALLMVPVVAQDAPAPGEGGIIIEGNLGGDVATTNPILAGDTASTRIADFLFPGLIGVDPATANFEMNRPDALVTEWTSTDDGKVYTFTMRDDWKWSDGTAITSDDVIYGWNAITSGVVDTQLVFLLDIIEKVEAPDANTIVVTFKNAGECTALNNAGSLEVVPSHVLPADFNELNNAEFNLSPTVTGGVFSFGEFRAGEQVTLLANQSYGGATDGQVLPTGYIYKNVPDATVLVEQFLAGENNLIDGPAVTRRADVEASGDAGESQVYKYPGNAWDYLALNFADPTNPQNGLDDTGKPIDQGHHPLFGDLRVRQAVSLAIDVDSIIEGAVLGYGTRMPSVIIPASWAFDANLPVIPFNVEEAGKLLDEAGFVDDDNDPATPRVAKGAMYAADGTSLKFVLYTNQGNTRRETIGTLVQDQLKQVGFEVDFQAIEFNTLLDIMDGQTFDAFILGWRNGYPDDPDMTQLFTAKGDVLAGGSNNASYYNPKFDELNEQARTLPGCDPAERAEIYHELQKIAQDDLPYIPLYSIEGMYAARSDVNGFSPYPAQMVWNIDTWYVATP